MTDLATELNCHGFYGFGSGWALYRRRAAPAPGAPLYCNRCPARQSCWDQHKARATELFPEESARVAELIEAAGGDGGEGVKAYAEETGGAMPPDLAMLTANMEDGGRVALEGRVNDRGPYTLPYPFEGVS